MSISTWMTSDPVVVAPDTPVSQARAAMRDNGIRHLPVVDDAGRLVGIVSDRDIRIDDRSVRRLATADRIDPQISELLGEGLPVEAVMTESVHTVGLEASVGDAARLMLSRHISAAPVVDAVGAVVGIVTTTDCLLAALTADPILG